MGSEESSEHSLQTDYKDSDSGTTVSSLQSSGGRRRAEEPRMKVSVLVEVL